MLVSIGIVAEIFGVNPQTIRNWTDQGIFEICKTKGGHRRYVLEQVEQVAGIEQSQEKKTIIYSRVSSHDQKQDRDRQTQELKNYCADNGVENIEIIEDLGSGLNYKKKGLVG